MTTILKLICCVLCIYSCYKVTEGQIVKDCCLRVSNTEIPKRIVKAYNLQVKGQGCSIDAVIFVTKKNRALCTPPGLKWVNNLILHVDNMNKKCQANNYQGKQCLKLKPQPK